MAKRGGPPKANAATLEALGAERLAELLVAAGRSDQTLKRRLTLEVARTPEDIAQEVDRQIDRFRSSKGRLTSSKSTLLARELTGLLNAIVTRLGDIDAPAAAVRLLDILNLAPDLLIRRTGEGRPLLAVFASIAGLLAAVMAKMDQEAQTRSVETVYRASLSSDQDLLAVVIPTLEPEARSGLHALADKDLTALQAGKAATGSALQRAYRLTEVLAALANADGDVDAFVAAHMRRDAGLRDTTAVGERLLQAGRAREALDVLDLAPAGAISASASFKALRVQTLDALGRRDEAQAQRWAMFRESLSADLLRSYLKRLPDFEDVEREEEAFSLAEQHPDTTAAIAFLAAWPNHRRAGALVRARHARLNGEAAGILGPAAEALAYRDPLAATLLLRAIIDAVLRHRRTAQYGQVGRFLVDCAVLATSVTDWEGRADHAAYVSRLRSAHGGRKVFWRAAAPAI